MPLWLIQPHDSLIARDARPFSAAAGARARTLPFAPPSMVAGATRGRIGSDAAGVFRHTHPEALLDEVIVGPFLVELDAQQQIADWWFPAPADAIVLAHPEEHVHRLVPLARLTGQSNLPAGLTPVGMEHPIAAKPRHHAWWRWRDAYTTWLESPADHPLPASHVFDGLPIDERTHVAIDPLTGAVGSEGGNLFVTAGLSFRVGMDRQFALAVSSNGNLSAPPEALTMGGERRIVHWTASPAQTPQLPPAVLSRILETRRCRVVLVTPAYYTAGWRPTYLLQTSGSLRVTLDAVAGGKPIVQSGWAMRTPTTAGGPKPSRRFAPAGSVYWLSFEGTDAEITDWVNTHWMTAISDTPQDRNDGAGIALIGAEH